MRLPLDTHTSAKSPMACPGAMTLAGLQNLVAESKGEWEHLVLKKSTGELHGGMEMPCTS